MEIKGILKEFEWRNSYGDLKHDKYLISNIPELEEGKKVCQWMLVPCDGHGLQSEQFLFPLVVFVPLLYGTTVAIGSLFRLAKIVDMISWRLQLLNGSKAWSGQVSIKCHVWLVASGSSFPCAQLDDNFLGNCPVLNN